MSSHFLLVILNLYIKICYHVSFRSPEIKNEIYHITGKIRLCLNEGSTNGSMRGNFVL